MAMQDQILFTGRELNFEIPEFKELNAASDRLNAKLEKREDLARKLQDEFRKGMRVDSQVFVSDFARKQQFEAVTDFENKWTKIVRDRGNKLTNEDLIEMENDKAAISRLQNEWLSSQKLWERDQTLVEKSPADFDLPKHVAATEEFLTSGVYKPGALEFSGVDMASYFNEEKWQGANPTKTTDVIPGTDFNTFTEISTNATLEEAKAHVVQTLFADKTGRALKGVINDFTQLPPDKKLELLKDYDRNNNNIIEEGEIAKAAGNVKIGGKNMLDNPIIKWAQDHYSQYVLKKNTFTDKQRATHTGGTGTKEPVAKFTKDIDLPDGSKGTIVYSGAEAQAMIAEAEAERKKKEAENALTNDQVPWGEEGEMYNIPSRSTNAIPVKKEQYKGYEFLIGTPRKWGLKEKKDPEAVFNLYDPEKKAFLFSYGGKTYAYTVNELPENTKQELYRLKVKTPSGIKTIEELITGKVITPTAEQPGTKPGILD